MAVDQLPPRRTQPSKEQGQFVRFEDYIDTQIQSTRRMVKLVDWATALVTLAIGLLAFGLAIAVVEHWLVPGGLPVAVRVVLLLALLGGAGYFAYRRIWPLCVQAINPVYAAKTIEQGSPTLKNSLINLLMLRGRRAGISDAVYRTLEEQAARQLVRMPIETAVDRSYLIRLGYVLVGVAAIAAVYKLASPKDPLVTIGRVLMPWADIVPASRVSITGVEPGGATISRGETLRISAEVRGLKDTDPVLLRYTTADGQSVDRPIVMTPTESGLRFEARLPDESDPATAIGVQQNLSYRIEAGDGRSRSFAVRVVPAPSILVYRIEYDYPDYTGYQDRQVDELGDIRALEGTRVTIRARANGLIDEADVDFDADGRRDLRMSVDGTQAWATFELGLRADRLTPRHSSYMLRFTNKQGRANREPVKHPIEVFKDYSPEVAILTPPDETLDVQLDETVLIEVEARDPDFALAEVRLQGEAAGRRAFDQPLLEQRHAGRFHARYAFTPREYNLRAGDVVEYWAVVTDNRTPTGNQAESLRQTFRILSPDPPDEPPADHLAQNDPRRQQPDDRPRDEQPRPREGEQQPGGRGEPQQGAPGDQQGESQGEGREGEPQPGGTPEGRQPEGEGEPQAGQPNGGAGEPSANQQPPAAAPREGQGTEGEQREAGQPGGDDTSQGEPGDSSQTRDGENQGQRGMSGATNDDRQGGQPGAPSDADQPGGDPTAGEPRDPRQGDSPQDRRSANGADGEDPSRQQPGQPRQTGRDRDSDPDTEQTGAGAPGDQPDDRPPSPVSAEGDDDGTAFDRIRQHLEQTGEMSPADEAESQAGDSPGGEASDEASQEPNRREQPGDAQPGEQEGIGEPQPGAQPRNGEQQGEPRPGEGAPPPGEGEPRPGEQQGQGEPRPGERPTGERPGDEPQPAADRGASERTEPGGQPQQDPATTPTADPRQADRPPQEGGRGPQTGERPENNRQPTDEQGGGAEGQGEDGQGADGQGAEESTGEGSGAPRQPGPGGERSTSGRPAQPGDPTRPGEPIQPGDPVESDSRDGEPGSETPGAGGEQQTPGARTPDQSGDPGRTSPNPSDGGPGDAGAASGDPSSAGRETEPGGDRTPAGQSGDSDSGASAAAEGSGGEMGSGARPGSAGTGAAPPGGEANLEYARKQTDLVLERLSDQLQRDRVDPRLLDELGWSREEMEQFVRRWQGRKQAANRPDPSAEAARRELDDALRSLGLRRGPLGPSQVRRDDMRDLRQGYRGPVPIEYQERLRIYNDSVSRTRPEAE